ncbi:hypothetical protein GLI01_27670 [Gluconacetobacter liquefaciens]|nr:hypothetical protein GLI01_27670 [Gluconacetobacter liquefaciens]
MALSGIPRSELIEEIGNPAAWRESNSMIARVRSMTPDGVAFASLLAAGLVEGAVRRKSGLRLIGFFAVGG